MNVLNKGKKETLFNSVSFLLLERFVLLFKQYTSIILTNLV